jgi:hypothetical protein
MGSSANASTASATTSGGTGSYTNLPPYRILLGIENTSNENNWLESAIVMWVGTLANIPDDWTLCDGGGGTPDLRNKFILMASSGGGDVGGTSGTDGHTHSAPSTHTHSGSGSHTHSWPHDTFYNSGMMGTSSYTRSGGVGRWGVGTGATHYHPSGTSAATTPGYGSGTQTISTTSDTQPAFRTVAYLMAPEEPSSGNAMFFAGNF